MSVEIGHLTKVYGEQKAIDDISFSIHTGEIVGFLGPNGAGKSTTLKIITGFLMADAGSVKVNGLDVNNNPVAVKKMIGYLPEANPLYLEMYIREYLAFVADLHLLKNKKERIETVIQQTGLTIESNKKIGQLSKGYKQRTGIAAALIHDPAVLILDEPTSGLDPNQIHEIRTLVMQLGKQKTVLFSSHILQEVEAMCKRVIIINKGKIVADDDLQKLQFAPIDKQIITVRFSKSVEKQLLNNLKGASNVYSNDLISWHIEGHDTDSLKRQLLELSLKHNLNIVSLQGEKNTLEQVFKQLTS